MWYHIDDICFFTRKQDTMASLKSSSVSLLNNRVFRLIVIAVAAYFVGVLSTEKQVEIREVVKIDKERESELLRELQETKRKMEDVAKDVVTEETIIMPDGTKKIVKTIDKSKIVSEEVGKINEKLEQKEKEIEKIRKELTQIPAKTNYSLGVSTNFEWSDNPLDLMTYEAVIGRRIVSDIWVFGQYNWTKQEFGLGIRWDF